MFCDEINLKLVAGKGGDGMVSFRREKFVAKGGPDGGDGGRGGSIVFKVNTHLNTLSNLASRKTYKADAGVNGARKNMHGRNADNLTLEVPKGTIIYNSDKSKILADLDGEEKEVIVARGGKGGMGNANFVSSTYQAPKFAENGEPGEEKEVILELKLVADIGLIGMPSAGKSTLISVISNAKPKIAAYEFTTLIPNLGVVNMAKFGGDNNDSFVATDIPGLIEGASEGRGLGHQFLKHVTRTKILIHVIDGSKDEVGENYKIINKELKKFDKVLAKREQIIALNKIDLLSAEEIEKKKKELIKASKQKEVFLISGVTNEGIKPLMFKAFAKLVEVKKAEEGKEKPIKEIPVLKPHLSKVKFEIEKVIKKKDKKIFRIVGARIEQIIQMTSISNPEGLERMYHFIEKMGIKKAIEKQGATFGDIIKIKDKNIPYRK